MGRPRDGLAARSLIFSALARCGYSCAAGCSTETGSDAGKVFLRALNLAVPSAVLARADEVIE